MGSIQTRIRRRKGTVRAKIGAQPRLTLPLPPRERIISCDFEKHVHHNPERKTRDWTWVLVTQEPVPSRGRRS